MEMQNTNIAVVHIINRFKVKRVSQAFRCVFVYQDLDTKFCFVRALQHKNDLEIVMELFKIFTSYKPPSEVHVNSCTPEMVNNMTLHMKELCPMFNVKFVKKNCINNDIAIKIVTKLHKWMETTKQDEWEIGCSIIQREINSIIAPNKTISIQEAFFKHLTKARLEEEADNLHKQKETDLMIVKNEPIHDGDNDLQYTNTSFDSSNAIDSINTVNMKRELEDSENSFKDRVVVFDGGLIFPSKQFNAQVEIKMERIDEE